MTTDSTDADDFLRDLAAGAAAHRQETRHRILRSTHNAPTATHIARRHMIDRLRDEWQQTLNTDTETKE